MLPHDSSTFIGLAQNAHEARQIKIPVATGKADASGDNAQIIFPHDAGVPAAIDLIGQYQDAGVDMLIIGDRNDVETRELFVSDVMPHFA